MRQLTDADVDERLRLRGEATTLALYHSPACPPCREMLPAWRRVVGGLAGIAAAECDVTAPGCSGIREALRHPSAGAPGAAAVAGRPGQESVPEAQPPLASPEGRRALPRGPWVPGGTPMVVLYRGRRDPLTFDGNHTDAGALAAFARLGAGARAGKDGRPIGLPDAVSPDGPPPPQSQARPPGKPSPHAAPPGKPALHAAPSARATWRAPGSASGAGLRAPVASVAAAATAPLHSAPNIDTYVPGEGARLRWMLDSALLAGVSVVARLDGGEAAERVLRDAAKRWPQVWFALLGTPAARREEEGRGGPPSGATVDVYYLARPSGRVRRSRVPPTPAALHAALEDAQRRLCTGDRAPSSCALPPPPPPPKD